MLSLKRAQPHDTEQIIEIMSDAFHYPELLFRKYSCMDHIEDNYIRCIIPFDEEVLDKLKNKMSV